MTVRKDGRHERACAEITKAQRRRIRKLQSELTKKGKEIKRTRGLLNWIYGLDAAAAVMKAIF